MRSIDIRVEHRTFFRACTAGLAEKTAVVDLSVDGDIPCDPAADARIRAGVAQLRPGEQFFGIAESDWPTAFLVDTTSGEWLGEWVVALTVAIQRWGRDPVFRGRVLAAGPGLRLAIPWHRQAFFDEALGLALQLIARWLNAGSAESGHQQSPAQNWQRWLSPRQDAGSDLDRHFNGRWAGGWEEVQAGGLRPNTLRFVEAAVRRGMPFDVLPTYVQIGWGANSERFDLALTGRSSWIAAALAVDKFRASRTLAMAGLPVSDAMLVVDADHAQQAAEALGWPVVVKPANQDGGLGVQPGIRDPQTLRRAVQDADRLSPGNVLVEKHFNGADHRILVVDGQVLQVARRTPATVVGDGIHTVRELVDLVNTDPRRGTGRYSLLKTLVLDAQALACLTDQDLHPDAVAPEGRSVLLSRTANISSGGTAEDVTAATHPDNLALAIRAARVIGLDIAGVDFLCPDITRSWREVGGVICEVNGQPGFRPHWLADPERDLNGEILDILFGDRPARIPTAAVTGTNGKTTTCEMLHRIWTTAGKRTGVCTTARLRIGEETVSTDNLSGQPGARIILTDPGVEAAVIELPRKGLIYFGHPCDRYDVAALLNVQDDHIGVDGVDSVEQMAELKAEVLQRATVAVVVNAEDPLCLAMRARAGTDRHILVARDPELAALAEHRRDGGKAVFLAVREGRAWIVLADAGGETDLVAVHDIPATMNGALAHNETNAMFAAAVAWAQGVDTAVIRTSLETFRNTADQNPGRYTFIDGLPHQVLVDFAHNPDGVRGICMAANALAVTGRRLLCSINVGSRHPSHVQAAAPVLVSTFDEFVLGCDPKLVGGCAEYAGDDPAATMVARSKRLLVEHGAAADRITVETDPVTAIDAVFDRARPGDLVVLLADYDDVLKVLQARGVTVPRTKP